jgi:hypothetical protein
VQRAVLRDGGRNSSEILFNFAALALVRTAVKPATSQSRFYVARKRGTIRRDIQANFDLVQLDSFAKKRQFLCVV